MKRSALISTIAMSMALGAQANTWNEPWQETVVQRATHLGLYKVDRVAGGTAHAVLVKQLAGEPAGPTVDINGYSHLDVTSASSNHWDLWLKPGRTYYLYLAKGADNAWQLQTPSAGADWAQPDGQVQATYRISMHKALVPASVYEMTQRCIFQALHGTGCDREPVDAFIQQQLREAPAPLGEHGNDAETARFFLQHAALETAAALHHVPADFALDRHLASASMHVQFSALKLLAASQVQGVATRLASWVCSDTHEPASRMYALHLIARHEMRDAGPILKACLQTLPGDERKFGLTALMDPRIGTHFPYDLRADADRLLETWSAR